MLRILQTETVIKLLEDKLSLLSIQTLSFQQERYANTRMPKLRNPTWFVRKERTTREEFLTPSNREFIRDSVRDEFAREAEAVKALVKPSTIEWTPNLNRTGIIARKIGEFPMWLNSGKKIHTTLLQVLDNHVIKYYPPEEYDPPRKRHTRVKNKQGCLLLGAESTDPTVFTKEYCGIFKNSGVLPKKFLARFFVSPNAALSPGTPLSALHFTVGNYVDVRGKTADRGFQGVMKRHGFKGMPASHGTTKTHRRGGCIGGGGEKGRVWPGTRMPGHMGNRSRVAKGLKIWRINTKYNVLFVSGCGVPGETNSIVYIHDTKLPLRKPKYPVAFPTYFETENKNLEEDIFDESLHKFSDRTIIYEES